MPRLTIEVQPANQAVFMWRTL